MGIEKAMEALQAPGTSAELARQETDTAAFFAARSSAAPVAALEVARRRRLAAAAVAATVGSAFLLSGAAAAVGGSFPGLPQQASPTAVGQPEAAGPPDSFPAGPPSWVVVGSSAAAERSTTPSARPSMVAEAALVALCRAFGPRASDDPATGSTTYERLATAAAAAGVSVADYCVGVVAAADKTDASASAAPGSRPATPPGQTQRPSTAPVPPGQSLRPSTVPAPSQPSSRASARPSSLPSAAASTAVSNRPATPGAPAR